MRILCWLGVHDWGGQSNVRNGEFDDRIMLLGPLALLALFMGPPKVCDRRCLRCGTEKTFSYDHRR